MADEKRKIRVGRVVSDKMSKTVIVAVEWKQPHSKYGKPVRRTTKLIAHDVANNCRIGDLVKIVETRPLSKTKRWRVLEILSQYEVLGTKQKAALTVAASEPPTLGEELESTNTENGTVLDSAAEEIAENKEDESVNGEGSK